MAAPRHGISFQVLKKRNLGYVHVLQRLTKLQFGVFEKFTNAYFFQIAREKSGDYLLII